ncbi:MAG: DUF1573 domain-containing protein [Bacteroidota bacterium]
MKKLFIALFLIAVSVLNAQQSVPKITSTNTEHNFGEILEGQVVSHTYEIMNTGTADLKIDKIQASCGCTAAQPAKKLLKPGEKTTIKVEFDSSNRMGFQQKYVYVFSNDPDMPQLRLSFSALIVERITNPTGKFPKMKLEKNQIDFGTIEEGTIKLAKINFQNVGSSTLEITDIKTTCDCTAALLSSKKVGPGESGTLRIELDTTDRSGKLTRTILLVTNDPTEPRHVITLFANIEKKK